MTEKVIGCAIEVRRVLGPGLLESAYEQCVAREFSIQQVCVSMQVPLAVGNKGIRVDCGFRIDALVENS